ncbi:MAG TPA: hypothetical protein VMM18_03490 [Gemmatimonadaceae bacterium]|nr:hypothetical protein [Gemmatimonadaceae bacterium]
MLAQRYTYATIALVVGLLSLVNFFGIEKSILAILLGLKALDREPRASLGARRSWAKAGVAIGAVQIVIVATVILLNLDRIPEIIEAFRALSDAR